MKLFVRAGHALIPIVRRGAKSNVLSALDDGAT